jgi:hypothetical protein
VLNAKELRTNITKLKKQQILLLKRSRLLSLLLRLTIPHIKKAAKLKILKR